MQNIIYCIDKRKFKNSSLFNWISGEM